MEFDRNFRLRYARCTYRSLRSAKTSVSPIRPIGHSFTRYGCRWYTSPSKDVKAHIRLLEMVLMYLINWQAVRDLKASTSFHKTSLLKCTNTTTCANQIGRRIDLKTIFVKYVTSSRRRNFSFNFFYEIVNDTLFGNIRNVDTDTIFFIEVRYANIKGKIRIINKVLIAITTKSFFVCFAEFLRVLWCVLHMFLFHRVLCTWLIPHTWVFLSSKYFTDVTCHQPC